VIEIEAHLSSPILEAIFREDSESTPTREITQEKFSVRTFALHLKRKRAKAPMVVSEVRSERLKDKTQGYKADSCIDRQFLCSSTVPLPPPRFHHQEFVEGLL
jgi:hypothetical protein